MRYLVVALTLAALMVPACADELPNPAACADYARNRSGGDPDCDAAIAAERDPAVKSVLLFRRAFMIIDRQDFNTYPRALADLDEALRLNPDNYRALHERAYLYNEYGRWADAARDLDRRIALRPQDYQGYQERAMSRMYLGDLQGSFDDRAMVVKLRPDVAGPLIGRAEAEVWLGRFEEAVRDLDDADRLTEKTPGDQREIVSLRAEIQVQTRSSAQGAAGCTDNGAPAVFHTPTFIGDCTLAFVAATTPKAKADALTLRGIAWMMTGNEDNGRADFAVAKALDPQNPTTHMNLGFALMQAHHSTAAIAEFDAAIALHPSALAYAGRASAKYNLRDLDGAIADAVTSLGIERNPLALIVRGDAVHAKTNSYDEAKTYWIAAYRLGEHSDSLANRLRNAGVPVPPPDDPAP